MVEVSRVKIKNSIPFDFTYKKNPSPTSEILEYGAVYTTDGQ